MARKTRKPELVKVGKWGLINARALSDHCVNGCRRKRDPGSLVFCRKCGKRIKAMCEEMAKVPLDVEE